MREHVRSMTVVLGTASAVAVSALLPGSPIPAWLLGVLILVAAAVAALRQYLDHDAFPREWAGYLIAYVCWGSMAVLTAVVETPSVRLAGGVGIAVGYLVFANAIVWFHRTRVVGVDRDWMIDSSIVLTAVAIGLWASLDVTQAAAERFTPLEQAAVAIAALIHLSFLTLTARLLVITGWRALRPYVGTTAGLLSAAGSALYFTARVAGTETPLAAHALWALAAIALAGVLLLPPAPYMRDDDPDHHPRPFTRFSVLASALVLGSSAVLWSRGTTVDETVPLGGALVLCLLVLWRMHGLFAANEQAKGQLERLAAQQATLAELGRRSLARTDVHTFMDWAGERIRTALRVDSCAILKLDPAGRSLLVRRTDDGGPYADAALPLDANLPPCRAASTGELVHVQDVRADARFDGTAVIDGRTPIASASARIEGTDGPYGVLVVGTDQEHEFGPDELEFVSGAADMLAVAVDRIMREERIRHASLHDALTGLPNRALLFDRLDHALATAQRRPDEVALLFIDLDGFKQVNDHLGHVGGDALLVEVARRLRSVVRVGDTLARFGGDEFVLLAEDVPDEAAATGIAEHLTGALAQPFNICDQDVSVSGSVGIATTGGGETAEQLLRRADDAMYRAKARGRANLELAVPPTAREVRLADAVSEGNQP